MALKTEQVSSAQQSHSVGGGGYHNICLTVLRTVKKVASTSFPEGHNNIAENQPEKALKRRRGWWGWFRLWEDGNPSGRAHISLMMRKKVVVNLHYQVYSRGKFPCIFRDKDLEYSGTVNIPLPVIMRIAELVKKKGLRVQKLKDHKYHEKWFKEK